MHWELKCVIFGDRYVIQDDEYLPEVEKLLEFLNSRGIKPIILSNNDFTQSDNRVELRKKLTKDHQYLEWYIADADRTLRKPNAGAVNCILEQLQVNNNEAIYIGNSDIDMETAVNSKILFLNAIWYDKNTDYGFEFKSTFEIARFIDIFCLREYLWQYSICYQNLEYYALGIFGNKDPEYSVYTNDAKQAAKQGRGHLEFWLNYLISSIYFSGLHNKINYIAPYPGHSQDSSPTVMEKALIIFAKCFSNISYLKDLITRHSTATKSAYARYNREYLDCFNQLNTICLNKYPTNTRKKNGEKYKKSPLKPNKTVLIIDDFCTQGYSLEAARNYIEQTGAKTICLSLLKTIYKDYEQIVKINKFSPFEPHKFDTSDLEEVIKHPYKKYIINPSAHVEIGSKLQEYDNWSW